MFSFEDIFRRVVPHLADGMVPHVPGTKGPAVVQAEDQRVSAAQGQLPVDVLPVDLIGVPSGRHAWG